MNKTTVTAHTGCCNTKMNTIDSLKTAVESGADIVEFDVRFKDGVPYLNHNPDIPADSPTMEQAFEFLADKDVLINIDIKETSNIGVIPKLAEKYGITDRYFFTGVWPSFVKEVRKQCPDTKYYLNIFVLPVISRLTPYIRHTANRVSKAGAVGINCHFPYVTPEFIEYFHKSGLEVSLWTLNDEDALKKFIPKKPDNITSRIPDIAVNLIKQAK